MKALVTQWQGWVCILFLFFTAAFMLKAGEFVNFARAFVEIHNTWRPARARVDSHPSGREH
jgi:hypothetical protein